MAGFSVIQCSDSVYNHNMNCIFHQMSQTWIYEKKYFVISEKKEKRHIENKKSCT